MESLIIPLVITNDVPEIIWVNAAWSKMTGYSVEEAFGKNPSEVVKSGKMRDDFYEQMWADIGRGKNWSGRIVNKRKNGHIYIEEMSITPFLVEEDGKTYYIAAKEDVTIEEKLTRSLMKDKHAVLFDSSESIMLALNIDGEIEDINQYGAELLEYKPDELRGKKWFDVAIIESEKESIKSVFKSIVNGNANNYQKYTNKVITKNGITKHISWHNRYVYDSNGNINGILSNGWDITALVEKTEFIERQNDLLSLESEIGKIVNKKDLSVSHFKDIVSIIGENKRISNVWIALYNSRTGQIRKYHHGIENINFDDFITAFFEDKENKIFKCKAFSSKFSVWQKSILTDCKQCPLYNKEDDGYVASWSFNITGDIYAHVSILFKSCMKFSSAEENIIHSIFNLIRANLDKLISAENLSFYESKLKTSEKRQSLIFDNSLAASYIISPSGKMLTCNKPFLTLIGVESLSELLNADLQKFYPDDYNRASFIEEIKTKGKIENEEKKYLRADGTLIYVIENTIGLFNDKNELIEIQGFLVDITELVNKERKLKEALDMAKESERLKAAFLSNISHEIRTPMNHIMGFAHILRDPGIDEETRNELLFTIEKSGGQLVELIADIIDLSKIDAGQMILEKKRFDLSKLITEIISDCDINLPLEKRHLSIKTDTNVLDPVWVFTDPVRLRKVFSCLLTNAVKFTHAGEIKINYGSLENNLYISVKDTGIGIKESDHKNIFNRFVKGLSPKDQNYGGTGLGLSLAKELVTLLGGYIWVESELNKGSEFKIVINNIGFGNIK